MTNQDNHKSLVAKNIIQTENIALSTQVINEVCFNLLRKANLGEDKIQALVTSFYGKYTVMTVSQKTMFDASLLREKYQFSFWDSLLIASGLESGATLFYSEDMHDGLIIAEKLQIINPFKP